MGLVAQRHARRRDTLVHHASDRSGSWAMLSLRVSVLRPSKVTPP